MNQLANDFIQCPREHHCEYLIMKLQIPGSIDIHQIETIFIRWVVARLISPFTDSENKKYDDDSHPHIQMKLKKNCHFVFLHPVQIGDLLLIDKD